MYSLKKMGLVSFVLGAGVLQAEILGDKGAGQCRGVR